MSLQDNSKQGKTIMRGFQSTTSSTNMSDETSSYDHDSELEREEKFESAIVSSKVKASPKGHYENSITSLGSGTFKTPKQTFACALRG